MKILRTVACILLALALAGCGPIIGMVMKTGIGVKEFQVKEGNIGEFVAVKQVLVYAPFQKAEGAYFICRGEDEANLANLFQKEGLFETAFYLERDYGKGEQTLATLRSSTPEEVQAQCKLRWAPDAILSGKILERDDNVAPTVGIIQEMKLRLDLYNLRTKKTASVEIAVKELHQQTIAMIVKELKRQAGKV
jgi:hypothetical protein